MKRTELFEWHRKNEASMGEFGGYEMPLWYPSGAAKEHLAVLYQAGLFDTGHMSVLEVRGREGFDLLQRCFTRDLNHCMGRANKAITRGHCVYGAFLTEAGHLVDDALVYMQDSQLFNIVVNAGMGSPIKDYLLSYAKKSPSFSDVSVEDLTSEYGKIDLQGPRSLKILKKALDWDRTDPTLFNHFPYFSFKGNLAGKETSASQIYLKDGSPVFLSRTGYTGEFGFEIFVERKNMLSAWKLLLKEGNPEGLLPCGLAARDSLRAGAGLPLSHQDMGDWIFKNNPWPFAVCYNPSGTGFTKDFIGSEALLETPYEFFTCPYAGFDPRKVNSSEAVVENAQGEVLGRILTCVTDISLGRDQQNQIIRSPEERGLSCGFLEISCPGACGRHVFLVDKRRRLEVEIRCNIRPERTAFVKIDQMEG